ncbi:MAG: glycosyltransferase [Candidatus Edwardsbacteria bacterium]|nr:glycosyltransferase [Candidatus Edwardsbacteria bacterium]MBU1577015.1 glycosyltransferase [Candidatus Edwardsbacteria bacterium]MBU2464567.1 glycosyltransferase [Candidatus Edwardsbacteria bacterium]MBU2593430.1 glycosyltransferase [Candidatus Edwardsbacteria bacterium]
MSYRYQISVIIPSFRNLQFLQLCLPEYLKSRHCQVIIGLDGYNQQYLDYLREYPVAISVTQRRQGLCTATNLAAGLAEGEYLFLCNDDMVPSPGWDEVLLSSASLNRIVSGTVWEPGLIEVPPCHKKMDFGHTADSFRRDDFINQILQTIKSQTERTEKGINYPFLIPAKLWEKLSGLDERFNPGSASDPDFFIRAALLDPAPEMIRCREAIFYHFAGRSGIYAGDRVSLWWKFHWKHSRMMFKHKWGRMWEHKFGQVPDVSRWENIKTGGEPWVSGRLWREAWFGAPGKQSIINGKGA